MTRLLIGGILALAVAAGESRVTETTLVRGRVVSAIEGRPVVGAVVGSWFDSVRTDDSGAYELRVGRAMTWIFVRKDGFLDFQYPMLLLTSDTLVANVELRTDPPSAASYAAPGFLPMLCIRLDDPGRLDVTNSCLWPTHPKTAYRAQMFKHNPWSPYFGQAGDRGGVLLAILR